MNFKTEYKKEMDKIVPDEALIEKVLNKGKKNNISYIYRASIVAAAFILVFSLFMFKDKGVEPTPMIRSTEITETKLDDEKLFADTSFKKEDFMIKGFDVAFPETTLAKSESDNTLDFYYEIVLSNDRGSANIYLTKKGGEEVFSIMGETIIATKKTKNCFITISSEGLSKEDVESIMTAIVD